MNLHQAIIRSLPRLLTPVVRLALKHGLKFQDLTAGLKEALVRVASENLSSDGLPISTSRLAAQTGLQRKDLARLLEPRATEAQSANLMMRIVGQWRHGPKFGSRSGRPKALTYEGANSEFAELVRHFSSDLNPYTILFELERVELVEKVRGKLVLKGDVFIPVGNVDEGFGMLAADTAELFEAVEQNISSESKTPHLHVKTHYDNICVDSLPEIRNWLLDQGAQFHEKARKYLAQHDKDLNMKLFKKPGSGRVSIATFSLVQPPKYDS